MSARRRTRSALGPVRAHPTGALVALVAAAVPLVRRLATRSGTQVHHVRATRPELHAVPDPTTGSAQADPAQDDRTGP